MRVDKIVYKINHQNKFDKKLMESIWNNIWKNDFKKWPEPLTIIKQLSVVENNSYDIKLTVNQWDYIVYFNIIEESKDIKITKKEFFEKIKEYENDSYFFRYKLKNQTYVGNILDCLDYYVGKGCKIECADI